MKLLVGLGNPESCYFLNRHNVGFMLIDALNHYHNTPAFKSKFNGLFSTMSYQQEEYILLKPSTFMNRSGECVQKMMQFYKIALHDVIVFHDDLDIPPFEVRTKKGGGSGGHNGLKSIDLHCGNDYWRYRFGIGRPPLKDMVADYVLSNFSKNELQQLSDFLENFAKDFNSKSLFTKA